VDLHRHGRACVYHLLDTNIIIALLEGDASVLRNLDLARISIGSNALRLAGLTSLPTSLLLVNMAD